MIHSHNFPKELKCAQNCRNVNMKEKNPLLWEETRVQRRPASSLTNQNVSSDLLQRGENTLQCIPAAAGLVVVQKVKTFLCARKQ